MKIKDMLLYQAKKLNLAIYRGQLINKNEVPYGAAIAEIPKNIDTSDMLNLLFDYYCKGNFDEQAKKQIGYGLEEGLDVSLYAKPEFTVMQMLQIRWGLELGLDAKTYAHSCYDYKQMQQILFGLDRGIDTFEYARPDYSAEKMRDVREDLERKAGFVMIGDQVNSFYYLDNEMHMYRDDHALDAKCM